MKKNQTQIKKYAAVISIFLAAVIVGLFVFFFCIKRSVEQRSKNTMRNNVVRQSEHLRTILDIQYDYLNGLAEEIGKTDHLLAKKNMNLIKSITKHTDFGGTALIKPNGDAHYDNGLIKNLSHRRYFKEVIGALGGSYDVTALSRMLFEDLFNGQGCSMIIAQNGEIIAFEGDTSYWNLDYRDNFYKYCCKWIIKDKVTVKKIKQDFKEGKENLVTADSKKEGTRRHYFAYMPMGVNGWILCYALPEQAAQQSYNFIEDYEISFMIVFIVLVTLLILYIVYENHTRNKELLKYAQTDALTGLYNKETTEQLTDELLSEDENKYHAFLILDVDCFKQINDIYGHAVGDIVLQKFGKLLKGTFREGDILGRIGGDEFGVIMKNIQTKDIAMKKAEELLAKTQAYKIDELKGNNISISIGISTAPQDGDCYMDLYKRADQALYQAKRSGKARVCNYFS